MLKYSHSVILQLFNDFRIRSLTAECHTMELSESSDLAVFCDQCKNISFNYFACSYCEVRFDFNVANLLSDQGLDLNPTDLEVDIYPVDQEVLLHPVDLEISFHPADEEVTLHQTGQEVALHTADQEVTLNPSDQEDTVRLNVSSDEAQNEKRKKKKNTK